MVYTGAPDQRHAMQMQVRDIRVTLGVISTWISPGIKRRGLGFDLGEPFGPWVVSVGDRSLLMLKSNGID